MNTLKKILLGLFLTSIFSFGQAFAYQVIQVIDVDGDGIVDHELVDLDFDGIVDLALPIAPPTSPSGGTTDPEINLEGELGEGECIL